MRTWRLLKTDISEVGFTCYYTTGIYIYTCFGILSKIFQRISSLLEWRSHISWKYDRSVWYKNIDKVYEHVCGHSFPSDRNVLLLRNGLLTDKATNYLHQMNSICSPCKFIDNPHLPRNAPLSTLVRSFNGVVCTYHMFLEEISVMHFMDSHIWCSVGVVINLFLKVVCEAFLMCCFRRFGHRLQYQLIDRFRKGCSRVCYSSLTAYYTT